MAAYESALTKFCTAEESFAAGGLEAVEARQHSLVQQVARDLAKDYDVQPCVALQRAQYLVASTSTMTTQEIKQPKQVLPRSIKTELSRNHSQLPQGSRLRYFMVVSTVFLVALSLCSLGAWIGCIAIVTDANIIINFFPRVGMSHLIAASLFCTAGIATGMLALHFSSLCGSGRRVPQYRVEEDMGSGHPQATQACAAAANIRPRPRKPRGKRAK